MSYDYQNSSSTYLMGGRGEVGEPIDCSGLMEKCLESGVEDSPIGQYSGTGVQQLEQGLEEIELEDAEEGNIVTFRTGGKYPYHTGIITNVEKDDDGNVTNIDFGTQIPQII